MKRIQLWAVERREAGSGVISLGEMANAETESLLEDLLVASPDLLLEGLSLVARQLQTEAGFPDLLGVDQDGRLVVLELKRGTLTREAVAQVLDYGSDLGARELEELARLIEEHSGKGGVSEIEDFLDWHGREYPDASDALKLPPRMLLVGLGVDDRARRIVNFLADAGIDIQLLTFYAFESTGTMLLARQVETESPTATRSRTTGTSKAENLAMLLALAERKGAKHLLTEVGDFIEDQLPCYRWPGRTAFSYSLQDLSDKGTPTYRAYVTLYIHKTRGSALLLTLPPRAVEVAADAVEEFVAGVREASKVESSWAPVQAAITKSSWAQVRPHLEALLAAIGQGWQQKLARVKASESSSAESLEALSGDE